MKGSRAKKNARRFSLKEDRQAKHIEKSEEKKGVPAKKAKAIAYGHINKVKSGKK